MQAAFRTDLPNDACAKVLSLAAADPDTQEL
jgi:hypothetical protein